jgi:Ca2+-transporting ATPase
VIIIIGITFFQERKTERALEALRDLSSPRALVIRGGQQKRIAGREVVSGDIVLLSEGDRVPADSVLLWAMNMSVDESLLTGESVPVRKVAGDDVDPSKSRRPGGDDLPYVFSGSLVARGTGIGEVIAIGARSEIGKIGQSLRTVEAEQPRLQRQTRRLVRIFAMIGGAVSVLAVLLHGLLRGGWLDAVLAGIALGMSMLPEEFPVVVFMAMGAWRISRARVLTRRAAAIETLGSATVLCTDKTGTLTENRMSMPVRLAAAKSSDPAAPAQKAGAPRKSGLPSPGGSRSTPWRRRFTISLARNWPGPNVFMAPNGNSYTPMGFAPVYSRCQTSGRLPMADKSSSSRPRERLKPSPIFATLAPRISPR